MKTTRKLAFRKMLPRIYRIFSLIKERKYISLEEITNIISYEYGKTSVRTIKRDIRTLKDDFRMPISYSRAHGGYYLYDKAEFPFPKLTEGEVFSLLITANMLRQFRDTPLEKDFETLQRKLEFFLQESSVISSESMEKALSIPFAFIKPKVDVKDRFEKILKAIRERRRVLIKYHSFSRDSIDERKVDPYHLYNFEGVWYFCGYCHLREEMRDFALDRIIDIKLLNERFQKPKDFDFYDYIRSAFRINKGDVEKIKIKFDSYQARWIKERIWHETQKIEDLPDGGIIYEVTANREEIKRWVMGYGSHAEVLEPESLRDEIKEEIKKLNEIYFKKTEF